MAFTSGSDPLEIVFLDRGTLPNEIRLRSFGFANNLTTHNESSAAEIASRIQDADIVITNKAPISAASLTNASRLKLIAVAATGTDIVDVAACAARGITVSNIRNYASHTVPEHTFALILALRRNVLAYRNSLRDGRWQHSGQFCYFDYPIHDLAGSTLGVIGDGVLGRSVAAIGKAFGMRVLFSAYKGTTGMGPLYTPFPEVLRQSDVITLHTPLSSSTRNLIADAEFAAMERHPIIINTARGGLVDEEALARALRSGQIAAAGFDVVTTEPPPADHIMMQLLDMPNFILTPHVAWASHEAVQGLADQLVENIELFVEGRPRNVVTN